LCQHLSGRARATRLSPYRAGHRSVKRRGSGVACGEVPLPDPLAEIAQALRDRQAERTETDGWLMPSRHAGQHITADRLQQRLKRYRIQRSRGGRHAPLLALAARLPAPILAERIGIQRSRAAAWVRLAGGTYADYVTLRTHN